MNTTHLALPLGVYQGFSSFVLFAGSFEGWGVEEKFSLLGTLVNVQALGVVDFCCSGPWGGEQRALLGNPIQQQNMTRLAKMESLSPCCPFQSSEKLSMNVYVYVHRHRAVPSGL